MKDQDDLEVMENLWLGSSAATVYVGQCDAILTLGPKLRVEEGIRHRHADFPESNEHEAALAAWVTSHWLAQRNVLIRAYPLVNGRRIAARVLLNIGADTEYIAAMLGPKAQNGNAA